MSATMSKSLRGEVLNAAKMKRDGILESVEKMYQEHAKKAAAKSKKEWTVRHERKITAKVHAQLDF